MIKTFLTAFKLQSTYRTNTLIYTVKKIPGIGKLIPDTVYSNNSIKGITQVVGIISELLQIIITKPLYVLLMMALPILWLKLENNISVMVHVFVMLTLAGAVFNSLLFNPTKDKYYALILLKMDAMKYTISQYVFNLFKGSTGIMIGCFISRIFLQLPLYFCLGMPIFFLSVKIVTGATLLLYTQKSKKVYNENKPSAMHWIVGIGFFIAAYGLMKFPLPEPVFWILFIIVATLTIPSFIYIFKFKEYKRIYRNLLIKDNIIFNVNEFAANTNVETYNKKINKEKEVSSNKLGYAYFHELFIKRHSKLIYGASRNTAIILSLVFLCAIVAMFMSSSIGVKINPILQNILPWVAFSMIFINKGQTITAAMFANCDRCMLHYSFYRNPKSIVQLFTLRLKTLVISNLPSALIMASGLTVLLFLSGGTEQVLNYVVLFLTVICLSVFFSVHYLTLYYLFQPYTEEMKVKNIPYTLINSTVSIILYVIIQFKISIAIFGLVTIILTVIYVVVALILTYALAHKTFRLRIDK